jgi:anaerobic dimethyl sulfoxide reductase subunit B (iron-sulfur subunit)
MRDAIFVVDVATCTGCFACSVACKDRSGLPDDLDLLRVESSETGAFPDTGLRFRVIHCFHCEDPPCVDACPSNGIVKRADGLVAIDEGLCSGCGECVEACPFDAIVMRPDGTSAKCDGCVDETARGWDPTCVRACPMRALYYGPRSGTPYRDRVRDTAFQDHGIGPSVACLVRATG